MKRERVLSALMHEQTDIIPHNMELSAELKAAVKATYSLSDGDFERLLDNHIEKVSYNRGSNAGSVYTDEFGISFDRGGVDKDIGIITDYLLKSPSLDGYSFPKPDLDFVRNETQELLKKKTDTLKLGKIGTALFERAWSLRGFENFFSDLAEEDDFVFALLDKITDFNSKIIKTATEYELDGFYFGDDYGMQSGLLMSPSMWQKYIKPSLAKLFSAVKERNKFVFLHSCGDISLILDDLVEIGLDVYQTLQPEVYDLKEIKKRYGKKLSFWGGISTQQALPFLTPEELSENIKEISAIMGENGGYIAAPTHQIPADVPVENVYALAEILKNNKIL